MSQDRAKDQPVAEELLELLDDIRVGLVMYDGQARATSSSFRARELLGLEEAEIRGELPLPAGWALIDETGRELTPSEHPAPRALDTGKGVEKLVLGVRRPRQKDVVWTLVHTSVRVDSKEDITQIVVAWVDLTDRKRAEEALRDSEIKYRTLFESMDAAVLLMEGAVCIDCNPATAVMFGVPDARLLIGKTPLDYAPEYQPDGRRSADLVRENIELALKDDGHAFEWHTTRADGSPIVLEVLFTPFALGCGELFQCIARDVTERSLAARRLLESETKFRAIIERAAEGILVADASTGRLRYANPEMCRMLGYRPRELVQLTAMDIHPPGSLPSFLELPESPEATEPNELRAQCLCKNGDRLEVSIRSMPILFEGSACVAAFFRDESNAHLLEQERLRTQKLEAVGTLAGGIAHDFNNLLQGIFGFLSMARQLADDPEQSRRMLDQAERALGTAAGLTGQLLTFSRGGQPVKKAIELAPVVASAANLALSGSRNNLSTDLPTDLWPVEADEGQVAQVVHNIVLNADQAMPMAGTVSLSARNLESPPPVLPPHVGQGRFVAISIRDTGIGIRAEDLGRVFDPYFTTKSRGSGLGLATAYSIVTAHAGFIDAQSSLGLGSTFTIYLPASDKPVATEASRTSTVEAHGARILVMDDEEVVRRVCAAQLRSLGHEATLAEDGLQAIELFRAARQAGAPFTLVILDLTVRGGMGGLEALDVIRGEDPSVKAIVSSGYSADSVLANHRAYGFAAVLAKPYSRDQLKTTLHAVLP